jgi:hypothetical protein
LLVQSVCMIAGGGGVRAEPCVAWNCIRFRYDEAPEAWAHALASSLFRLRVVHGGEEKKKGMDDGELRRPCPRSPGPLSSWQRILCSVTQSALVRFRRATVELPSRRPVSLTHGGTSVPDASHGIIELFLMDQNGGAHTSVATPVHLRVAAAATGSPSHAAVMTGTNHCVQPYTARQFTTR